MKTEYENTEEYEEEEMAEEEVEEFEEEEEYEESDVEESAEGETEEEDPEIPIVYEDGGEAIERNIKYSELASIVRDYDKIQKNLQEYNNYVQAVNPIVQTIQNSQILQSILYYKAQGYTEEQIKEGLVKLWQQEKSGAEEESYETYEDELKAKIIKEIENRIKPIETRANTLALEKQIQETTQHNNLVLAEVLKEEGISELTQEQLQKMGTVLAEMFPNTDFRLLRLNKTIAKSLVKLVKDESKPAKASKALAKGVKLPKIIQTKGARNMPDKNLRGTAKPITSLEERIKLKKELFK